MKVLQFLLLFICVGAVAQAQTPPDSSKGRMNRRDIYQELNLTKDQQEKVKVIMDKQREEMETLRNGSLSREEQRSKMMDIRKKYNEQIDVLLTPEQKEKLAKLRKEQQEEMQKRRNGQGGGNN